MLAFIDFSLPSPLPVGAAGYSDGRGSGERIPPRRLSEPGPRGHSTGPSDSGPASQDLGQMEDGKPEHMLGLSKGWVPIPALPLSWPRDWDKV